MSTIAEKLLQLRGQPSPDDYTRNMIDLWADARDKLFDIALSHPTPFVIVTSKPILPFLSLTQQQFVIVKEPQLANHFISAHTPAAVELIEQLRKQLLAEPDKIQLPYENLQQFAAQHPEYLKYLHYVWLFSYPVYIWSPHMLTPLPVAFLRINENPNQEKRVEVTPFRINKILSPTRVIASLGIYLVEWIEDAAFRVITTVLRHSSPGIQLQKDDWLIPITEIDISQYPYYPVSNNVIPLEEFISLYITAVGGDR